MANGTIAASQLEMLSLTGTGIITITPPATNTNRAITLPDAAGALVVSGTTPSLNGIAFPATQVASADANTLDDYEEGTYTPSQGGGLTVVGTFSSTGRYTKIGRMVYLSGTVSGSTSVAATAQAIITANLPFNVNGTTEQQGSSINAATTAGAIISAYQTSIYTAQTISATPAIQFNIAYQV